MKKIEAVIKPFKLDEVKEALHEVGPARHYGAGSQRASGVRRAIPSCIAVLNTWWIFYPR